MPLRPFQYMRPVSVADALALLERYGSEASVLAGGTDLLVQIKSGRVRPRVVIDIKRVKDLPAGVTEHDSFVRIGARELLADLIEDERIRARYPALIEAAVTVGSVQIRNRATLAGNICNASPAADTVPPLLVYEAVVNLVGPGGNRSVPLCDFFVGPGQTVREPVEILASVDLPKPRAGVGAAFARLTRRRGVDLATVSVCCVVEGSGAVRFAFGAAGPRPILVADESGTLADPEAEESEKERILKELIAETSPITDMRGSREYRHAMLFVLSRRALGAALRRWSPLVGGNGV